MGCDGGRGAGVGEACETILYEDSLKDLRMFSLEKERLTRLIIRILKYLKEGLSLAKNNEIILCNSREQRLKLPRSRFQKGYFNS